jgi:hypothetical protein
MNARRSPRLHEGSKNETKKRKIKNASSSKTRPITTQTSSNTGSGLTNIDVLNYLANVIESDVKLTAAAGAAAPGVASRASTSPSGRKRAALSYPPPSSSTRPSHPRKSKAASSAAAVGEGRPTVAAAGKPPKLYPVFLENIFLDGY